jgi:8-oxo-dGTP pyrophosphatase MutT (NUDIX family)
LRRARPTPKDNPRQSAVLALFTPTQHSIALLFTLRPTTLKHHGGQISFPGGGVEPQDSSYAETALRETQEELGIPPHHIEVLGEMTHLFIAPSQNLVHPFVGWMPTLPPLAPDPVEVAEVLTVPLSLLLDPATIDVHPWRRNGQRLTAPCYRVPTTWGKEWERTCIWGATAMILSEILDLIQTLDTS